MLSLQIQTGQTTYNFDYEDERRAYREELEKYRRENELLKKSLQLNRNRTHDDEREKFPTTSVDSGLDTTTPGMSSTFISSNALQLELHECKERERKLEEKVNILRKVRRSIVTNSFYNFISCFRSKLSHQYRTMK